MKIIMYRSGISLLLLTSMVMFSGCKEEKEPDPSTEYIVYNSGEGLVGAGGGKVTFLGNNSDYRSISIDIPAGALKESEIVSIEVTPNAFSDSPYTLGPLIELKPEDLVFSDSVKFTINFNSAIDQDDHSIICQYLPKRSYLQQIETLVDNDNNAIYTYIKHFSLWAYWPQILQTDLRRYERQSWPVIVDNYPSKPFDGNYINLYTQTKEDIMRAFSQWDYYTNNDFYLSTNENEDNIAIQFVTRAEAKEFYGGDPLGDGASGVTLWHKVHTDHRLILLNDDLPWVSTEYLANHAKSTTIEGVPMDSDVEGIESTMLHEIGHLFGLEHFQSKEKGYAIMWGSPVSVFPKAITCFDLEAFNNQNDNSCGVSLSNIGELSIDVEMGSTISNIPMVKVLDANDNGVPGVTIMFYNDSDIPLEYTNISSTDINGEAYLKEMHIPNSEGIINIVAYAHLSKPRELSSVTKTFEIIKPIIDNILNTTWDVSIFFNSTATWHADVTFNSDGTTRYDEPESPGAYLTYGKWSITKDQIHWDIGFDDDYIFDGTVTGNTMSGTFVYGGETKTWSAVKKSTRR